MARTKCRAGKAGRCRKQNCLKHGPWGLNTFVVNKALTNERGIWIEVTEDIQAELNPNQTVMRRVQQQWMCKREKLKFADKKQDLDTIDCSATEQLRGTRLLNAVKLGHPPETAVALMEIPENEWPSVPSSETELVFRLAP